jgi:hypothetical protein
MSIKRYYLYAGLNVHVFAKAEAVLKFSEEDDGMWVKWEDYARLKAEVERLNDAIMRGASVPDAYPVSEDQP